MAPTVDEQTTGCAHRACATPTPRARTAVPRAVLALVVLVLCALLPACSPPPTVLDRIRAAGELRIAMLPANATFYSGAQLLHGFDRDLLNTFAERLGVRARFVTVRDRDEMHDMLRRGTADLGAGLLPIAEAAPVGLAYGPSYLAQRQLVIQRRDAREAGEVGALRGLRVASAGTAQRRVLAQYLPPVLGYRWTVHDELEADSLLEMVADERIDCAIMPSTEYAALRRYFPDTRIAFALGAPAPVAWIHTRAGAAEMWQTQLALLRELRESGRYAALDQRYFGRQRHVDPAQTRAFLAHYTGRLPTYRAAFRQTARRQHLDWLLLAALSYQESHWRADARSRTGVRGLMMLTESTARALAVDRLDAEDSIHGGALYLRGIKARLPREIPEPERTWLALAAYNIGPAHLATAMKLTRAAGRDAHNWADVREFLPRLGRPGPGLRDGRARGHQAVHFVENVRRYYDLLRRLETTSTRDAVVARLLVSAPAVL